MRLRKPLLNWLSAKTELHCSGTMDEVLVLCTDLQSVVFDIVTTFAHVYSFCHVVRWRSCRRDVGEYTVYND